MSRILAIEALETSLPNSARMSCSLPSSLDVPKAPLSTGSPFPRSRILEKKDVNAGEAPLVKLLVPEWLAIKLGLV